VIEVDQELWDRFRAGDRRAYDEITEAYLPLVKITIGRMAMNLPSFVDYEELYSTGCMGLLSAVERYDPTREAKFTTYAITRIRGAVLDDLRSHDLLGRVTRDRVTRIREAEDSLRAEGETLSDESIAAEAGLSLDEYRDALRGDRATHMVSLSEPVSGAEGEQTLADLLESKGVLERESVNFEDEEILDAVEEMLDERERMLVVLYYHEGLTLKEIGEVMEVSESRVSQLHTEMMERVRRNLKKLGV
jgi:RNA polymerase sigma factor for flagellar operon FliA